MWAISNSDDHKMFEEFGNDCLSLVACAMIISIEYGKPAAPKKL